ncbi:MmgE/PrpD family protein [Tropicibacter sp. R16_0]|uniref:MmgE/PrpD family protein n=1 Tax=Tropicibacter sp. R16_0 TaxID=2821102 RepID=UPI001ADA69C6|nr:MmgE/PrpD family protein [Tropicibacter sp. R16_0]
MQVQSLARFAATATPSTAARDVAIPAVADCFGCILAGAESEVAQKTVTAYRRLGQGTAPVFGTTQTLATSAAALANAVAGHAWDLDDWEEPGNTHPTVVLLPALLAAAHLKPVAGRDLLAAYAVGCEIIMRLGEAVTLDHYARGFHSTATLGAIGAAGAVGRQLRLSEDQIAHAMAIATSQAVGYTVQFGSNAKPLQAGFAARIGVEAAVLAAQGATGQPGVIEHPRGFSGLMGELDPQRFDDMTNKIGAPWALEEYGLVLKPWPSCGYTHRLMTAALDLRGKVLDRLDQITSIRARLPDFHYKILPFDRPTTRNEALFSAPACIAQALVSGELTLADSAAGFWMQEPVDRLVRCTRVTAEPARNPKLNYDPEQPDHLIIELHNGEVIETICAYPLGAPQNPMNTQRLAAKFHSITTRPEAKFDHLLQWAEAPDVARVFQEFTR